MLNSGVPAARALLFGGFQLLSSGGAPVLIANRRARALLATLCLEPDRPIGRDTLIRMLWPGRFPAQARASLRQCLMDLTRVLESAGCPILAVSRERVGLHQMAVRTDLAEFEEVLATGDIGQAGGMVDRIAGLKLLDQLHISEVFDGWLAERRAVVEHRINQTMTETVDRLHRAGKHSTARRLFEAWSIRGGQALAGAAKAVPISKVRVAVLPLVSMGASAGEEYFADGIADELISTLGQVSELMVAGRTSSFHFRDSDLSSIELASALNVSHLIEGSVQRQGEAVRVHVHLVDGANGFELWGRRFDGTLDAIFELQERIAQAVTAALGTALGVALQPPLVHGLTPNKQAYDLFLQSRALNARLFGDGVLTRAAELAEEAVALDPEFAEAWVLLGDIRQRMGIYLADTDQTEASAIMADCVRKAMAIKTNLGLAYGLLALHEFTRNNIVGALDLAFKGFEVEPNNPSVIVRIGGLLMFCGLTRQGMRYLDIAIDQDPAEGRHYMIRSAGQLNMGNIDAAIADAQRAVDLGFPSMWLGVAHAVAGNHDFAVECYQQTRLLIKNSIPPPSGLGSLPPEMIDAYWLVAAKGTCSGVPEDRENYCRTLDMLRATMADKEHTVITMPAVFMGYTEMVYATIGTRITLGNLACLMSIWTEYEPMCRIWQDADFIPFAQRIGMAAAWDKYGWPDLLPMPTNR